jgi:site-specific DNA recombinase
MRLGGGGYRRDHLRALAQRVEVSDDEVRIMGSKSDLLRTLVAAQGGKSAAVGVPARVLKWRRGRQSYQASKMAEFRKPVEWHAAIFHVTYHG